MDNFSGDGFFWLPDAPERRLHGTVQLDDYGVKLTVHESLENLVIEPGDRAPVSPQWKTFPVVQGDLYDGTCVSLLGVSGISLPGIPTSEESWDVEFALSGGHVEHDIFEQALFDFDALMAWASPRGIAVPGDATRTVIVDSATTVLAEATLSCAATCRLLAGGQGSWSAAGVHLDQWCAVETTGASRSMRSVLSDWVRPFQDFLIVALGRPIRLTSLRVRPPKWNDGMPLLKVSFAAAQSLVATQVTHADIVGFDAPTLLPRPISTEEIGSLFERWQAVHAAQRQAVTLLCGPFYAPFIYNEHRYASTFQAAEALARNTLPTTDVTKQEHKERVRAVRSALGTTTLAPDVIEWTVAVIAGRNDKPLWRQIEELTDGTGSFGAQLLRSAPNFSRDVARARTGVSHGGAEATDAIHRYWLGEGLTWVVRICLLAAADVPVAALAERTLAKPRINRLLRELSSDTSD